ncbi:MAG: nucleoside hydrolase [Candidatus Helarchaeota archaeon]
MPNYIILSTDPGIDDALAIIFLCKLNRLDAIWTTYGNNSLQVCTSNAMKVLDLLHRQDIPIIEGVSKSFSQNKLNFAPIHGEDGLGNTFLPFQNKSRFNWKPFEFIFSCIERYAHKIIIVSIGPLTNIANLIQKVPKHLLNKIQALIIMGGAIYVPGNVSSYAEFNIWCDPNAAQLVFHSGLPITLIGLDVTQKTLLTATHIRKIEQKKTPLTDFICNISRYYMRFHLNKGGCFLHDPLAAAYALDPSLIQTIDLTIDVISGESEYYGKTFITSSYQIPKISVGIDLEQNKFMDMFLNTILDH